jgi:hypothetical protein
MISFEDTSRFHIRGFLFLVAGVDQDGPDLLWLSEHTPHLVVDRHIISTCRACVFIFFFRHQLSCTVPTCLRFIPFLVPVDLLFHYTMAGVFPRPLHDSSRRGAVF